MLGREASAAKPNPTPDPILVSNGCVCVCVQYIHVAHTAGTHPPTQSVAVAVA